MKMFRPAISVSFRFSIAHLASEGFGRELRRLDRVRVWGDVRIDTRRGRALLVDHLEDPLRRLAQGEAAATSELMAKFSQDVKGFLEYSGLNAFYGGRARISVR